jgi:hypothetical protein
MYILPGGLKIFVIRGGHRYMKTDSSEHIYTVLKLRYMDKGGWDSIVGLATCYGLGSLQFKPWWEQEIFCSMYLSRSALGPTHSPLQWVLGLFFWG